MIELLRKSFELNKERIAYTINGESITYDLLWKRAQYYSELLKRQGTSPVIIAGNKGTDYITMIIACICASRTYIPLNGDVPHERLKKIISASKSDLVINLADVSIEGAECCKPDELIKYKDDQMLSISNDTVYIIFTSGSTGEPKGVPIKKENLMNFIEWICSVRPLSEYKNINVLNQANYSFDLSVADLYYSLCSGHTIISFTGDIYSSLENIFENFKSADAAVLTPTFIKYCLLEKSFNHITYPRLKCLFFCGEQLEPKTVRRIFKSFPDINVINAYGPTEATCAVSAVQITPEMAANCEILPVGKCGTSAVDISVENGEIVLRGMSVFSGYLNTTGGYFKEKGINCYRTGDCGYYKDGYLYCQGRIDRQIKFKGYRIELDEIEKAISSIKYVKDCAVAASKNELGAIKSIKAFVVSESMISSSEIKDKLKASLPDYMIPRTIKFLDSLPVSSNGKTDRKALENL